MLKILANDVASIDRGDPFNGSQVDEEYIDKGVGGTGWGRRRNMIDL
jgi:hypothetical protein